MATYTTQLDICKLLVEKFLAQKQNIQLRDYFEKKKDGVIIFQNDSTKVDEINSNSKSTENQNFQILLTNLALIRLFDLNDETNYLTLEHLNSKIFYIE